MPMKLVCFLNDALISWSGWVYIALGILSENFTASEKMCLLTSLLIPSTFLLDAYLSLFFCIYLFGAPRLSCSVQNLVSRPGTKPRPPALGAQSVSHWATTSLWPKFLVEARNHLLGNRCRSRNKAMMLATSNTR